MYMDSNNYEFKSDKTDIHTTISGAYVTQCISEAQLQLHVYRCACVHVTSTCMASCTHAPRVIVPLCMYSLGVYILLFLTEKNL